MCCLPRAQENGEADGRPLAEFPDLASYMECQSAGESSRAQGWTCGRLLPLCTGVNLVNTFAALV